MRLSWPAGRGRPAAAGRPRLNIFLTMTIISNASRLEDLLIFRRERQRCHNEEHNIMSASSCFNTNISSHHIKTRSHKYQPWQDHLPDVPPRLLLPPQLQLVKLVANKCLQRRGSRRSSRKKGEGRRRRERFIGRSPKRFAPLISARSFSSRRSVRQAWGKGQTMQQRRVLKTSSIRRSVQKAWGKGQTVQQRRMHKSSSSRRSVHQAWGKGQTMQQGRMHKSS